MRTMAGELHRGNYAPCPPGMSRRMSLAVQHIYEGCNSFRITSVRGSSTFSSRLSTGEAILLFYNDRISFRPSGFESAAIDIQYEDVEDWNVSEHSAGIEFYLLNGDNVYFGVQYVRDIQHTVEFFWNHYCVDNRKDCKAGSTHGRPLVSIHTLSGEVPAPEAPIGQTEIVDQDGLPVRPGSKMIARRGSILNGIVGGPPEPQVVPPENHHVKAHWNQVVKHQGWLLKKGGVGVGTVKSWIKRYFVLYTTSQGHFLSYYSDFTECPMYTSERNHRNFIDMSKACYIRPGSVKSEESDTPPNAFDIVTTEREWTLCAESKDDMQKWLKLLTRAIDEDVAILPDEELLFKVKPKVDPTGALNQQDYSTALKASAFGVSVAIQEGDYERQQFFWIYTDFYKWSLLTQNGKIALLVNVFADETFTRRNEFVFRHKEAMRMATAIEYFIEKFMSVMHVKLELLGVPEEPVINSVEQQSGMHGQEEVVSEMAYSLDLLDLDTPTYSAPPPPGIPAPPVPTNLPSPVEKQPTTSLGFASDPFGDDPFDAPPVPQQVSAPKLAPPISPEKLVQMETWFRSVLISSTGLIYDDGCFQVAVKIDMKGSQGRVTLYQRNVSSDPVTNLFLELSDPAGMLRHEMAAVAGTILPGCQQEQLLMFECMKPVAPGPSIVINYESTNFGKRKYDLRLPVLLTSFNEPLQLGGADFVSRWQQLTGPGQQAQEVFKPPREIQFQQLQVIVGTALKFAVVSEKLDGDMELAINGASSLQTGAKGQSGEKINVGSLIKIEFHPPTNQVRVTVRTLYPGATQAVMQTAKSLLS